LILSLLSPTFFFTEPYSISSFTLLFLCSSNSPFPFGSCREKDIAPEKARPEVLSSELTRVDGRDWRNPKTSPPYSLEVLQIAHPSVLGKLPSYEISEIPSNPISTNTSLSHTVVHKEIDFQQGCPRSSKLEQLLGLPELGNPSARKKGSKYVVGEKNWAYWSSHSA
jgi:hypothetical protein